MANVFIPSEDGIRLEAIFHRGETAATAIITHPHPLYGGTMHNYVLEAIESVYQANRYATLRFNFRGVGNSGGAYSKGKGEVADVVSALAYAREMGAERILLAGYSFGAWVNAHVPANRLPDKMVMVSPPVALMDFSGIAALASLKLVITGENDDIAPPSLIKKHLPGWNPEAVFRVIENTDHFYGAALPALKAILDENR